MSETTSTDIAIPVIGEIVSLEDFNACSFALDSIRDLESRFREIKGVLTQAIAREAGVRGTRTLELKDGRKAIVSGGEETQYDAERIQEELAAAGMPSDRIAQIVEETVSLKVKAVEAKRAAAANALYATIIDENSREVVKPLSVSIRRS